MMDSYNVYCAVSPEFGNCKLEILRDGNCRVLRLLSEQGGIEYAIAEDAEHDITDCKLYTDDDYYYLTSYLEQPVKTVRVNKGSIRKLRNRQ